jgi:hypothetical protein
MASIHFVCSMVLLLLSRLIYRITMADNIDLNSKIFVNERALLSVPTYNCRGFNFTKTLYINNLLTHCDVFFIQEHCLAESQISLLDQINSNFLCCAVSSFDNSEVLAGRPFGGCAILWRSDIVASVETVATNSRRVCAIKLSTYSWNILFVNVYMPYEDGGSL